MSILKLWISKTFTIQITIFFFNLDLVNRPNKPDQRLNLDQPIKTDQKNAKWMWAGIFLIILVLGLVRIYPVMPRPNWARTYDR